MSDWEKLAEELEAIVSESVKDLLQGEAPKYKAVVKDLATDFAQAQVRMRRGTDSERAVAREARAVLVHSGIHHKSSQVNFKNGFANRRMNVTMLFGQRGG